MSRRLLLVLSLLGLSIPTFFALQRSRPLGAQDAAHARSAASNLAMAQRVSPRAGAATASSPTTPPATPVLAVASAGDAPAADSPNPALRPEPFYKRMRIAALDPAFARATENPDAALGQSWSFTLFPDFAPTGRVTRVEKLGGGRANFFGELEGAPGSDFIVTLHSDTSVATMSFTTPGAGLYQVRTIAPGILAAIELAPELLPTCALRADTTPTSPANARREAALHTRIAADVNLPGSSYGSFGQQGGSEEGLTFTTVDALIAYTAAAQAGAGGAAGVAALADHMIARANATFLNSRVGLRIRLVRLEPVTYTEPNNIETDLTRLSGSSDGFLDGLHALRTSIGADLVTLLTETTGSGTAGLAYLYNGSASSTTGFSVVKRAGTESTYVHEVGHNFGCEHDRDNTNGDDFSTSLYPYAYGHRFTPAGYGQLRTVMAYAPGDRIPYFSNPDVTYLGTATGVAIGQPSQAHNAQVLNNTKAALAALRAIAGNQPPAVTLTSPTATSALVARQTVSLAATATDPDGSIATVRFYRLSDDDSWAFSNVTSASLGGDTIAPYELNVLNVPAGYATFAAAAVDNSGAVSTHTVAVTINPWYKQELLSLPAGYTTGVALSAINTAGQIAGTAENGGLEQACRWDGTTAIPLGFLSGDVSSRGLAIADDGTVYGESISSGAVRRACRWSPAGVITDLSTQVAGQTLVSALGRDNDNRTLYALASDRGYRDSTSLGGNFLPEAIASSGLVGGTDYESSAGAWRAARWAGSSTRLGPQSTFVSSWGFAINRSGAVVGISSPTSGYSSATWRATYWAANSTTPADLAPSGSTASTATGINDHNEIIGYYRTSGDLPFLWTATTGTIPLRDLVMPSLDFDLYYPRAISSSGAIAVEGWNFSTYVPVRLTPVAGLDHDHWLRSKFSLVQIEGTGVVGDTNDPDNDGRVNLLERAFGLSPTVAETTLTGTGYPVTGFDSASQKLALTFRRLRAPTDLTYTVEATSDLADGVWSSAGAVEFSRNAVDADWDEVVYRSAGSPAAGAPVFLRVRVGR